MTPSQYLDEAKKTIGITSDYELAKRLQEIIRMMRLARCGLTV